MYNIFSLFLCFTNFSFLSDWKHMTDKHLFANFRNKMVFLYSSDIKFSFSNASSYYEEALEKLNLISLDIGCIFAP